MRLFKVYQGQDEKYSLVTELDNIDFTVLGKVVLEMHSTSEEDAEAFCRQITTPPITFVCPGVLCEELKRMSQLSYFDICDWAVENGLLSQVPYKFHGLQPGEYEDYLQSCVLPSDRGLTC